MCVCVCVRVVLSYRYTFKGNMLTFSACHPRSKRNVVLLLFLSPTIPPQSVGPTIPLSSDIIYPVAVQNILCLFISSQHSFDLIFILMFKPIVTAMHASPCVLYEVSLK